jgi:TonB family protein
MMIATHALVAKARTGLSRALTILVCVVFALASCTNYKATLNPATEGALTGTILPRSAVPQKAIVRTEEKVTGSVRLRVDVSDTGHVSGVEIIEASDDRLKEKALDLIQSWPLEPGTIAGKPTEFEGLEYTMVFFTDDSTTTGEVVGTTVLVVLLVPLAVILGLASGGGSFKMGN